MKLKMFSMFSGIGGFDLAIKKVFKHDIDIVGCSEIDNSAIKIYNYHFSKVLNYGDATKIETRQLPEFDILTAGFPCQAFSIAGKGKGFEDARGTMFFEVVRILKDKEPKFALLENVKGLLSHNNGSTFRIMLEALDEVGYYVRWNVYNTKDYGIPQNRERIYLECYSKRYFGAERVGEIFYKKSEISTVFNNNRSQKENNIARCLTARQFASWNGNFIKQLNNPTHSNNRIYGEDGISPCLNTMQGGSRQPKIRINSSQDGKISDVNGNSFTLSAGHYNQPKIEIKDKIRRLTPIECERLQGYPDNWTKLISDTARYKTLGNSITVKVAEAIFERNKSFFIEKEENKKDTFIKNKFNNYI